MALSRRSDDATLCYPCPHCAHKLLRKPTRKRTLLTQQLIDALPHITVSDERRTSPPQPAEVAFAAAEIHGLTPETRRRGIKNPLAIMAILESWVPGAVAPSTKTQVLLRYAGRDVGASVVGIDPHREPKVSALATQMRQGTLVSLYRATNAIILGDRLAGVL